MTDKNKKRILSETASFEDKYSHYYPMPRFLFAGKQRSKVKWTYFEHHHVDYEWIYVRKGAVRYWINDTCLLAEEGDFYYVQPGQTHREESVREPLEFYFIRFYFLDLKGQINYFIPEPGIPEKQNISKLDSEFDYLFRKVYKESVHEKLGSKQIIESLLLYMTWLLRRNLNMKNELQTDKVGYHVEIVSTAISYLKNNVDKNITLKELGTYCCISQDYLSHIFKDITGISPLQYELRLKMDEAKSMLNNTSLSINDIGNKLGFSDQLYFSRAFKKIVQLSPSKYRKLTKEN